MNNIERKNNAVKSMCLIIAGIDMLTADPECLEILGNGIKEAKTRTAVNKVFYPAEHQKIKSMKSDEIVLQAVYDLCNERKQRTTKVEVIQPVKIESKYLRRLGAY